MNLFSIHGAIVAPSCRQGGHTCVAPGWLFGSWSEPRLEWMEQRSYYSVPQISQAERSTPLNEFSFFSGSISDEYPQLENKFVID